MTAPNSGKKQTAKNPGRKTDYSIPPEVFVEVWEQSATIQEVYETLKAYSEANGSLVMPQPIIASRAAEYREKLPLKRMPRLHAKLLNKPALTALVAKVRTEQGDVAKGDQPVLTRAQVEEVVVEVLERLGLVEKGAGKGRQS